MSEAFPVCLRDTDRNKSTETSGSRIRDVEVSERLSQPSAITVSRCTQKARSLPHPPDTKKKKKRESFSEQNSLNRIFLLSFPIRKVQVY